MIPFIPVSARAKRLSSYRTCQIHSFKLQDWHKNIMVNSTCVLMIQTRPKRRSEFVESIKEDIKWLGADWEDRLFFASDYFGQMYEAAVKLIKKGKAYVCDLSADQIREYRGTLKEPGKESPYRNRSVEENLAAV